MGYCNFVSLLKQKYADKSVQVGGHSSRRSNCKKHHARAERKAENVQRDLRKYVFIFVAEMDFILHSIFIDKS